jgi:phospholipase D1/2
MADNDLLAQVKIEKILKEQEKIEIETFTFYSFFLVKRASGRKIQWKISKSLLEIYDLRSRLRSFRSNIESVDLPSKRVFLDYKSEEDRLVRLKEFFKFVLENLNIRNNHLYEFFEVSISSFTSGSKFKEGYVYKYGSGRRTNQKRCFNFCNKIFGKKKMWLRVLEEGIEYSRSHDSAAVVEAINFCKEFRIEYGWNETEFICGVSISTSQHKFLFITSNLFVRNEFVKAIKANFEASEFNKGPIRFNSSFVIREQNSAKAYIDGSEYYSDVCDSLRRAKAVVCITDWWLSPELYLKRPIEAFSTTRLVDVLGEIADRGVQIYVILYKEITFTLTINSLYSKRTLLERNPNIKVIRHPTVSMRGGELFWSHHSKIVCIDNTVAYIGGLDLCYGRWDTQSHLICDLDGQTWPGIDYSNVRVADFVSVDKWDIDQINRREFPRMPWHDIAVSVTGIIVKDIWDHFIQLWNHIVKDITGNKDKNKVLNLRNTYKAQNGQEENLDEIIEEEKKQFENVKEIILDVESPIELDQLHPITARFQKKRRNTQLSNYISQEKINHQKNPGVKPISDAIKKIFAHHLRKSVLSPYPGLVKSQNFNSTQKITEKREEEKKDEIETNTFITTHVNDLQNVMDLSKRSSNDFFNRSERQKIDCQLVRSASLWSMGRKPIEDSIHTAYQKLIIEAKRFIYIENQFFISSTAGKPVLNTIAEVLIKRIETAIKCSENFKVIVVLPLLPAFEGAVDDPTATVLRVQLHYEYKTICRGKKSIMSQLKKVTHNPEDYIMFYSLRNHGLLCGVPVTEMIYVHSKLMIVDDTTVVVGSANINDRSLLGDRDAEVCLVINDHEATQVRFGDEEFNCSKFAHEFRMNIFKEHSGCHNNRLLENPFSPEFHQVWDEQALINTKNYRKIFRCYPDDKISKLSEVAEFQSKAKKDSYDERKKIFQGHLVKFPLEFLRNEDLDIKLNDKEVLLPNHTFT